MKSYQTESVPVLCNHVILSNWSSVNSSPYFFTFFYVSDPTLSSAEAVLLVYLGKATVHELRLNKDLKPLAKQFGLKYLRNLEKNTYIRAISSTLSGKRVSPGKRSIEQYLERKCCDEGLNSCYCLVYLELKEM